MNCFARNTQYIYRITAAHLGKYCMRMKKKERGKKGKEETKRSQPSLTFRAAQRIGPGTKNYRGSDGTNIA